MSRASVSPAGNRGIFFFFILILNIFISLSEFAKELTSLWGLTARF